MQTLDVYKRQVLQDLFMHMKGEIMAGKENREIKNSVFVDLFYEDESAEANDHVGDITAIWKAVFK